MDKQVDVLNKALNGEHIATGIYKLIIEKLDNDDLQHLLEQIHNQHLKHAANLMQRIKDIGGNVNEEIGISGWLAKSMLKLQTLGKLDELDALMMLYNGEDKGIAATEKLMTELAPENKELVEKNLSDDHDHLKILKVLISQIATKGLH